MDKLFGKPEVLKSCATALAKLDCTAQISINLVNVGDESEFDRYIKFTESNDAEDELGISPFSGVEKEIIYTIVKAAQNGEGLSFEDLLQRINKPRQHLSSFAYTC